MIPLSSLMALMTQGPAGMASAALANLPNVASCAAIQRAASQVAAKAAALTVVATDAVVFAAGQQGDVPDFVYHQILACVNEVLDANADLYRAASKTATLASLAEFYGLDASALETGPPNAVPEQADRLGPRVGGGYAGGPAMGEGVAHPGGGPVGGPHGGGVPGRGKHR